MSTTTMAKEELMHALDELPAESLEEVRQFVEFLRFKARQPKPTPEDLGWPPGFFEQTFGSLPDLPERAPQGDYEIREELA